jgi:hypothetical protein
VARVFLCIERKHLLIFYFNERSNFLAFSHSFWVSLEIALNFFFFCSIEQRKRDFTSEIWASRMMNTKKIIKSWIVGKSASRKKLLSEFSSSALWKIIVENLWISRWENQFFFVHSDVYLETSELRKFLKFSKFPTWTKNIDFLIAKSTNFPSLFFTVQRKKFQRISKLSSLDPRVIFH